METTGRIGSEGGTKNPTRKFYVWGWEFIHLLGGPA